MRPTTRSMVAVALLSVLTAGQTMAQSGVAQRSANERIVGGIAAGIGDGPWAVRLNITRGSDTFICGASLVSPRLDSEGSVTWRSGVTKARWVVTAAHCIDNATGTGFLEPGNIKAITGRLDLTDESSGEIRNVIAVMGHDKFNRTTLANDIALLVLDETEMSMAPERRRSIRLPHVGDTNWIGQPYLALVAQGWGRVLENGGTSAHLREVRVPQVDHSTCAKSYGVHGASIEPGMICAGFFSGGFDSCAGDSGGPLVFRPSDGIPLSLNIPEPVLVAAVSWGIGCARQDLHGIYTSIAYFRSWLDEKAKECLRRESLTDCE